MSEQVSVTLDEDDLYAGFRLLGQRNQKQARSFLLQVVPLALLIVLLLLAFPGARFAFLGSPLLAALLGVAILLFVIVLALIVATRPLLRRNARLTLRNHPGMSDPITHTIAPDTFGIRTVFSEAAYPWNRLHGWREDERIVLVLLTRQLFYVVPKRQLQPQQLELLRERLQGAGTASPEVHP